MNKFQINHLYMQQQTGRVIKILAQVVSPSKGDMLIAENLLSGAIIGLPADLDYTNDWIDITNTQKMYS